MPGGLLFYAIAVLILASGIGMLLVRNTVYSALLLVFNFLNVALLYLFMGAPFIAITQITVYAGAIMVLFLFVIMLLGTEQFSPKEVLKGQRGAAFLLAGLFVLEMIFVFNQHEGLFSGEALSVVFVSPAQIGLALFRDYALPFEMVAFILVAATVGAVLFTHKNKQKRQIGEVEPENTPQPSLETGKEEQR